MAKILIDNDMLRRQARLSGHELFRKYVADLPEVSVPDDEALLDEAVTKACRRLGVLGLSVGERAVFEGGWAKYLEVNGTIQQYRLQSRQMPRSVA